MPHREIEIHLHPRDPRGRIRSLRFRPRTARRAGAALVALAMLFVAGVAAAPRAIRVRLSARDYRAGVALRQELGDRLQALVSRLDNLARRGGELRARLARIERIYGIVPAAAVGTIEERGRNLPAAPRTIFAAQIAEGNRSDAALTADLAEIASAIERIAVFERSRPDFAAVAPVRAPAAGESVVLAGGFGRRRSPYTQEMEFHAGLDFAAPRGTAVVAPAAGVVAWAGAVSPRPSDDWWRLGRVVVLRHGDAFRTLFGHLDSIRVAPGKRVAAGELLGTVGASGWTTAPSLHYEIRRSEGGEWIAVDPLVYLLTLDLPERPDAALEALPDPDGLAPQKLPSQFRR
jgi:murein DD-endopeptidase MepM/ murein hydrolase activator NlpD